MYNNLCTIIWPFHVQYYWRPKIDNFLGKSKLNFRTKNEDFKQCVIERKILKNQEKYERLREKYHARFQFQNSFLMKDNIIIIIQYGKEKSSKNKEYSFE